LSRIIKINLEKINNAIEVLAAGGVVVYPTDTAYGLAVDATNTQAVEKLYLLKGRNFNKPIHVIFPSLVSLNKTVRLNSVAKKLIQKFLPGAITIVLPLKTKNRNWKILSADTGALGFRVPDHPIVRELIRRFQKPITATSANLSGKGNTYSVTQVKKQFRKSKFKPDFYLNGGKIKRVKSSTVITVAGNKIKLIREGPVPFSEIKSSIK
jgi:L-threonylcarbamoyladenylate synthase